MNVRLSLLCVCFIRSILLAVSLLWSSHSRADESLLGLPAPADPDRPGAMILHGGGAIDDDVFEKFIELAGGPKATIVFIPSAGFRLADYSSNEDLMEALARRYVGWVELKAAGKIKELKFLYTDNPNDADDPEFVRPLKTATGVWFSGGLQSRLNYRYVAPYPGRNRFQQLVRRVLENGGVVGGTSAGTAAMPEIMTMFEDRDSSTAPARIVAAHGLGLLDKAIVEQHFESRGGRLERFTGLLRDEQRLDELVDRAGTGARMTGIGIEEPAGLLIEGNRLSVLGRGNVHLFVKSRGGRTITWHEIASGESVNLTCSSQRDVVVSFDVKPGPAVSQIK